MQFKPFLTQLGRLQRALRRGMRIFDLVLFVVLVLAVIVIFIAGLLGNHVVAPQPTATPPPQTPSGAGLTNVRFTSLRLTPPHVAQPQMMHRNQSTCTSNQQNASDNPNNSTDHEPTGDLAPGGDTQGAQGEHILQYSDGGPNGQELDTINWNIINLSYGSGPGGIANLTYGSCAVKTLQPYVFATTGVMIILALIMLGYHFFFGSFAANQYEGTSRLLVNMIGAVMGIIASPWLVSLLLDFDAAIVRSFLAFMGIDIYKLFDYMGNVGQAVYTYTSSPQPSQNNDPSDPLAFFSAAPFVRVVVQLFLNELFILRLVFIDILIVLAPLAFACFILPQTRSWTRIWLTAFIPTVIQQTLMVFIVVIGITFANLNIIGSSYVSQCLVVTGTYFLAIRMPGLTRNIFRQTAAYLPSPKISDVNSIARREYKINPNQNALYAEKLASTQSKFAFNLSFGLLKRVLNIHDRSESLIEVREANLKARYHRRDAASRAEYDRQNWRFPAAGRYTYFPSQRRQQGRLALASPTRDTGEPNPAYEEQLQAQERLIRKDQQGLLEAIADLAVQKAEFDRQNALYDKTLQEAMRGAGKGRAVNDLTDLSMRRVVTGGIPGDPNFPGSEGDDYRTVREEALGRVSSRRAIVNSGTAGEGIRFRRTR